MNRRLCVGAVCTLGLISTPAAAFMVVGTDAGQSAGPTSHLVVLREEGRSIVGISQTARGAAKPLAVVIAVPRSRTGTVRVLPVTIWERADRLAAPRVDELWELDPCELHPNQQSGPAVPSAGGSATAVAATPSAPTEGDYELSVLNDHEAQNAAKWLSEHGYRVPEGADAMLTAALPKDWTWVVARIDGARLTFNNGVATLPPLGFVAEGKTALPLRLAAVGTAAHETIVDVLSPKRRLEAANLMNLAVPTNLDVTADAKSDAGGLYRALLDVAFDRSPGVAITEYAWLAASCDGCEGGVGFRPEDVLALGADRLPSGEDGSQYEVIVDVSETLSKAPEGPIQLKPETAGCYAKALKEIAGLEGNAEVLLETGEGGAVSQTRIVNASAEALGKCVEEAARRQKFDVPNAKGAVKVRFALLSRAYLGGLVMTRLRARTLKGGGADLELRAAAPIEGGREEGPTGEAEKKVYFAEHTNNFRSRYVVRHPWSGSIACDEPKRGVWGSKPNGAPAPKNTATPAATSTATAGAKTASPAEQKLQALLQGGVLPDLGAFAIPFRGAEPDPVPSASSSASAAPSPSGTTSATAASMSTTNGGCDCAAGGSSGVGGGLAAAITAIFALAGRRKQRRK
ncbi:MAG: DUF2330 domain-containing protein [Polyangiaceae bacterium]|nr:DUF2330 domain-containing protein [Polyangiaceae bacterium]